MSEIDWEAEADVWGEETREWAEAAVLVSEPLSKDCRAERHELCSALARCREPWRCTRLHRCACGCHRSGDPTSGNFPEVDQGACA
jgi:hypothetical protein